MKKSNKPSYEPGLQVHQVRSKGLSTRYKDNNTGRVHHVFSNLEKKYLLTLLYSSNVKDIKTQFPLDHSETISIAEKLGVNHPTNKNKYVEMTTDFVIETIHKGKALTFARTIKPLSKITKRTCEKFDIERTYWKKRGIDYKIITDKELGTQFVHNIVSLNKSKDWNSELDEDELLEIFKNFFSKSNLTFKQTLIQITNKTLIDLSIIRPAFYYFLYHRNIQFDLHQQFNSTTPSQLFKFAS